MISQKTITECLPRLSWEERQALPEAQALYFILHGGEIIYIGAAANLFRRLPSSVWQCLTYKLRHHLLAHAHLNDWDKGCIYQISRSFESQLIIAWWAMPTTRADLFLIEKVLIQQYVPAFNRNGLLPQAKVTAKEKFCLFCNFYIEHLSLDTGNGEHKSA